MLAMGKLQVFWRTEFIISVYHRFIIPFQIVQPFGEEIIFTVNVDQRKLCFLRQFRSEKCIRCFIVYQKYCNRLKCVSSIIHCLATITNDETRMTANLMNLAFYGMNDRVFALLCMVNSNTHSMLISIVCYC